MQREAFRKSDPIDFIPKLYAPLHHHISTCEFGLPGGENIYFFMTVVGSGRSAEVKTFFTRDEKYANLLKQITAMYHQQELPNEKKNMAAKNITNNSLPPQLQADHPLV